LCHLHPLWPRVQRWLTVGVDYPLEPITADERMIDLQANLERGNHQSALYNHERLVNMLTDEVQRGWQLLLPKAAVLEIKHAVLAPLGLVEQDSINEFGEVIPKWRLIHDQSFNVIKGTRRSVNDRLIITDLTPCRYGRALLRHIHSILGFRLRHPSARILQTKADMKSAYRRLHYAADTAVQAMVTLGPFALIALRLTFGGAANPSQWSDVSELATDLANDLVRDDGWDHEMLVSPHQHMLQDQVEMEDATIPLAQVADMMVELPVDDDPKADCYIDDIFAAFLERDAARGARMVPFALFLLGRPVQPGESLAREDLLSIKKFIAEATPSERKIVLGWVIDTRRLTIELPNNKHTAWTTMIHAILDSARASFTELEELIGRLNHAGFIIPLARHFLGRLRTAQYAANHRRHVKLTDDQCKDLQLWLRFLDKAQAGISLNLLSYRQPSRILRSDACVHGVGGASLTAGAGWRWELPLDLLLRATLNVLEYMASYITIWMDIHMWHAEPGSCFLSQVDSTSAAGWMRKSSFSDATPLHLELSRDLATLIMDHDSCLYSQWFEGDKNQLTDSLSRDHHLSDPDLLALLYSAIPEQMPTNFKLYPLPPELVSKLTTWIRNLPASMQLPGTPLRSKLATGATGLDTSRPLSSTQTHSSRDSLEAKSTESLEDLEPPSVPMMSRPTQVHQQLLHQYLQQSAPPSMLWHRPTGQTTARAPYMMQMGSSPSFYSDN